MSFFTVRFITVSSSPSSTPVRRARSLLRSTTCTFSTMFEGRFLDAICGSSLKNSLPSTSILVIDFPPEVMEPSDATSTPGSFLRRSSTVALGLVWKEPALNSSVSCLATTAAFTAVTTASFSVTALSESLMSPRSALESDEGSDALLRTLSIPVMETITA